MQHRHFVEDVERTLKRIYVTWNALFGGGQCGIWKQFLTNIASRLEEGHGADNRRFSLSVFSVRILKLSINIHLQISIADDSRFCRWAFESRWQKLNLWTRQPLLCNCILAYLESYFLTCRAIDEVQNDTIGVLLAPHGQVLRLKLESQYSDCVEIVCCQQTGHISYSKFDPYFQTSWIIWACHLVGLEFLNFWIIWCPIIFLSRSLAPVHGRCNGAHVILIQNLIPSQLGSAVTLKTPQVEDQVSYYACP
jgi:hypothetical protein